MFSTRPLSRTILDLAAPLHLSPVPPQTTMEGSTLGLDEVESTTQGKADGVILRDNHCQLGAYDQDHPPSYRQMDELCPSRRSLSLPFTGGQDRFADSQYIEMRFGSPQARVRLTQFTKWHVGFLTATGKVCSTIQSRWSQENFARTSPIYFGRRRVRNDECASFN